MNGVNGPLMGGEQIMRVQIARRHESGRENMQTTTQGRSGRPVVPCFSVVITSRHGSPALTRALRSVNEQTFRDYEVVVVESSPDDATHAIGAAAPRAKSIRLDRSHGAAAARNAGLAGASGRYVAFLDSTDLWHPSYLQFHHAAHQAMPNALFTFADYFLHGPQRSGPVRQLAPEPLADNALLHMVMRPFVHTMSCFVAPRADVVAAGGFEAGLGLYAEIDLCLRLLAGRPGRKNLACQARPAPSLPQVLAVKCVADDVDAIDDEISEWEAQRDSFIDTLFARPFMAPFADRKAVCKGSLARSQRAYFAAYLSDRVVPVTEDAETPAPAVETSVKAVSPAKPARRDRRSAGPATRIAMIHHGRCGSQVLGDLLDQHSRICWEGELFEPLSHKLPKRPMPHLRQRLRACKKAMYGFETKHYHPDLMGVEWPDYMAGLQDLGFRKFIIQRRANLLRTFVSALVGKAKGHVYHLPAGKTASLQKLTLDPQAVYFDDKPVRLLDALEFTTDRMELARRLLAGHDILCLTYEEDIAEDPSRGYRRACDFLGVEPEPVEIKYGRTTPFPLRDVIENFDEVKAALAGTEFEWMAEELPPSIAHGDAAASRASHGAAGAAGADLALTNRSPINANLASAN
jgi:glycosyltransferase involved in cell wall biosynthesis